MPASNCAVFPSLSSNMPPRWKLIQESEFGTNMSVVLATTVTGYAL